MFLTPLLFVFSLTLCAPVNGWEEDPLDDSPPPLTVCGGWGPEPCAFGDNAVLSSSTPWNGGDVTPARIFGGGTAGETITITGLPVGAVVSPSNPFTVSSTGSTWAVTIASPDSPTAFNLTFTGTQKIVTLHNVRFGLTWLCSGQSNMDMDLDSCFYANETVAASKLYPDIVYKRGPGGRWSVMGTDEGGLRGFSAVCIFTALHLKQSLPALKDVPIGVVDSSVGGTTIETWMSAEALGASGVIKNSTCGFNGGCNSQAYCHNYLSFILPLAPFTFKAMSWYQGESNVGCNTASSGPFPGYYASLLPQLVSSWRALFQTNFSSFIVSLAPTGPSDELPSARTRDLWPTLREAQLSVLSLPGTALVFPIDMGDDGKTVYTPPSPRHGDLHPRNKTEFGRRIALAYGGMEGLLPPGVSPSGPVLAGTALAGDGGSVVLTFQGGVTGEGLHLAPTADCYTFGRAGPGPNASPADCCQMNSTDPKSPHGFPFEVQVVAGGAWTLAQAVVEVGGSGSGGAQQQVRLTAAQCGNGGCPGWGMPLNGKVRYAWDAWPLCVLSNGQGLPLPPFVSPQ